MQSILGLPESKIAGPGVNLASQSRLCVFSETHAWWRTWRGCSYALPPHKCGNGLFGPQQYVARVKRFL